MHNLILNSKWKPKLRMVFNVLYVVYAIASGITLYETVFLGYHSLRQSLYGITLGITSHVIFATLLTQLSRDRKTRHTRYIRYFLYLASFWAITVIMNIWYDLTMKHAIVWFKLIPSTILTILCGFCGYILANYTD
jgi:hypothetical protein